MLRRGMAGLVLVIISASAASAVEVGRLRGHLEFLASEALEGRLTGTPEEQRATAYVAQQFENIGLKPRPAKTVLISKVLTLLPALR